jgi:carboxyl-terminal processing protease
VTSPALSAVADQEVPVSTVASNRSVSSEAAPTSTRPPDPVLSVNADIYLQRAINLMREWSINRDEVDWTAVEERVYRIADGAVSTEETHSAIRSAMAQLRDDHSVFLTARQANEFDTQATFSDPVVELRDDHIGYVSIGGFSGNIGDQADAYATELATELTDVMPAACGWIVDLRGDTGGNMWPMVGGLAPLVGTGHVGSFVYPNGTIESWTLADGIAYWDEMPMTTYGTAVAIDGPPVAVLIGPRTASSGEATAIAFHARPDTRFFGQSTAGLTTSNEPLALSDGALLILTMSVFTDRAGASYGQDISVDPDELVDGDPTSAATGWLLAHPRCGA